MSNPRHWTNACKMPVNELDHNKDKERTHDDLCQTSEFRSRVEKALKCKTCYRDRESAWVYREDDSYVLGYIGYMDMTRAKMRLASNIKYTCVSKNIINYKYNRSQDQHHMAGSKDIEKAVQNAKKYFRPWTPSDLAAISYDTFHNAFAKVWIDASVSYDSKVEDFMNSFQQKGSVFNEMGYLLNSDYEFKFPQVKELIKDIHTELNEFKQVKARDTEYTFVTIRDTYDGQQIAMLDVDAEDDQAYKVIERDVVWVDADDVVDEFARKLSVLFGLQKNGYIDGHGFKVAERCFYVKK